MAIKKEKISPARLNEFRKYHEWKILKAKADIEFHEQRLKELAEKKK